MNKGWIKLHRAIQDCWIWNDEPFSKAQAWIDLLLLANHRDKKKGIDGKPVVISRGQFHTSTVKLANRWQWDRRKVVRFLDVLEEDGMIVQKKSYNGTTLTIEKWEHFQGDGTTDSTTDGTADGTTDSTTDGTADGTQTRIKEIKNEKNVKNERNNIRTSFFPNDDILDKTFAEYVQMRKKLKKPFTSDHAIDLAITKLNNLSGGDNDKAVEILNQSIRESWQGLFPLKEEKKIPGAIDWSKV